MTYCVSLSLSTVSVSPTTQLDTEFTKMHEGKGDLFLRRWEASIMPKLKAVATKEKGNVASLVEGMEEQTDGMLNFSTK